MKILSYGSNMCSPRLTARVPSARFAGTGYVRGRVLRFHKRGRLDGSGKADLYRTGDPDDRVWGVIWTLDPAHKPDLDRAEGLGNGYEEERVRVLPASVRLRAYVASPDFIDPQLIPFGWYLDFVVAGAREHGLPGAYVEAITRTESRRDPDAGRRERNRRILEAGRSTSGYERAESSDG